MGYDEAYILPPGMAALSEIQRKKLEDLYNLFYDINKDGKVDWTDFQCAVDKISKLNGWKDEDEKKKQAVESLQMIWDCLKKKADINKDNVVSHDEWIALWSDCAESIMTRQEFPFWLSAYMGFMFDATDTSGDNIIDRDEYKTLYSEFGVPADQCDKAYDLFTSGGKAPLDRELYSKLWHEYFLSEDVESKGNALFGRTEW